MFEPEKQNSNGHQMIEFLEKHNKKNIVRAARLSVASTKPIDGLHIA